MSKKYFIDDGTKLFSVKSNHRPSSPDYVKVIPISDALLREDDRWLQVENIDDGTGNFIPTVTVDALLKVSIQEQDLADQLDREAAEQAIQDIKDDLRVKADRTKNRKIDSLVEIKNEIKNIYDILDDLTNRLL